jgi:hypothetical protein
MNRHLESFNQQQFHIDCNIPTSINRRILIRNGNRKYLYFIGIGNYKLSESVAISNT